MADLDFQHDNDPDPYGSEWLGSFADLRDTQISATQQPEVAQKLAEENLKLTYTSWSDVERAHDSSVGRNITDMQFFAVPPKEVQQKLKKARPFWGQDQSVAFPTFRSDNFEDQVDIMSSSQIPLKVKNRFGQVVELSLQDFLANIGHFITDLPLDADWSDRSDSRMQVASQFSILPAPTGQADVGIGAFGYQHKNLHIIIGPSGDIGWLPEQEKKNKIYFRDGDEWKTIKLVPEDRQEVKDQFFQDPGENETGEQEGQRYEGTENFIHHIQIEINAPPPLPPKSEGLKSMSLFSMLTSKSHSSYPTASYSNFSAGLNLARVVAGDCVANVQSHEKIPERQPNGELTCRQAGVACRLTKMYYAVAQDGLVTPERIGRFCDQMSYTRRSMNLEHGSLVTGYGSWGGPDQSPIKLATLPPTMEDLHEFLGIQQWPSQNLIKFITNEGIPPELQDLPPGDIFEIVQNIQIQRTEDGQFIGLNNGPDLNGSYCSIM